MFKATKAWVKGGENGHNLREQKLSW